MGWVELVHPKKVIAEFLCQGTPDQTMPLRNWHLMERCETFPFTTLDNLASLLQANLFLADMSLVWTLVNRAYHKWKWWRKLNIDGWYIRIKVRWFKIGKLQQWDRLDVIKEEFCPWGKKLWWETYQVGHSFRDGLQPLWACLRANHELNKMALFYLRK